MAAQPDGAEYKSVRCPIRGLQVLQALNKNDKGRATSSELSIGTGLHRTTVRRILETLVDVPGVLRSGDDQRSLLRMTTHPSETW